MAALPRFAAHPAEPAGLFLSFEDVVSECDGGVSAAARLRLLRLFQAVGGAVAVFSAHGLGDLDRALGLPDLPLIGRKGEEVRLGHDLPTLRSNGLRTLLAAPPFADRPLWLFGLQGAGDDLLAAAARQGGACASGDAARLALAGWLDRFALPTVGRSALA
ncbi:MAG: hypothetical protein KDC18_15990 [Alphaproteobacteria bacterium]|nr:hypothetical protein [Alphaproteobacteria bacterium]MCB9929632.1 hypothetical protein [Alphaproteobacteria bacterium]